MKKLAKKSERKKTQNKDRAKYTRSTLRKHTKHEHRDNNISGERKITSSKKVIIIRKKPSVTVEPAEKKERALDKVPVMFRKHVNARVAKMLPRRKPYTLGIRGQIINALFETGEYEGKRKRVRICVENKLKSVCRSTVYLKAIRDGKIRYGLNGGMGFISDEERLIAKEALARRKRKKIDAHNSKDTKRAKKTGSSM